MTTGYIDSNKAVFSSIAAGYADTTFTNNIAFAEYIDPIVTSDSPSCIIPFSRAGNLIVIKAKVDTTEGNFILDTGAPELIRNITYFRHYLSTTEEFESGGITGTTAASPTRVKNLSFGPIKYYKAEADSVNLGHKKQ